MSAAQLLSGNRRVGELTSSVNSYDLVKTSKRETNRLGAAEKVGARSPALAARTASTLSVKNL